MIKKDAYITEVSWNLLLKKGRKYSKWKIQWFEA
jgi:hypothetical protein